MGGVFGEVKAELATAESRKDLEEDKTEMTRFEALKALILAGGESVAPAAPKKA